MGPRSTVLAGLLAGVGVALVLLIAAVLFLPEPTDTGAAPPAPGPTATATVSASPGSSGSPAASVTASIGTTGFHVGQAAPALFVPQLGGGQVSLASLAGHPVWVNFMQTTCPPCVDEFPVMSGFAARYADSGLVVVAIDVREDEGTVAAFVQSVSTQFPVGLDADGSAAKEWDAVALPVHFWIDRAGIIRAGALGGIGPDIMAQNLATILPGVNVTP
jgi:cytochrome c biogenesis protein CcmG/thiol:disulfide interchange protein DsbE